MLARKLSGALRSVIVTVGKARVAYALDILAAVALSAFIYRYSVGYIPHFLVVWLPVAAVLLALAITGALLQRTTLGILSFLIPAGLAAAALFLGLSLGGIIPPVPTAMYKHRINAAGELYVHTLPGDLEVFRDGFDKAQLRSLDDLGRWAARYSERWMPGLERQGFRGAQAKAVGLMLFTSTLWAFGNANAPDEPGCITANEDNRWQFRPPTFETVRRARIGCCDDYAYALSLILSKSGFENRYVVLPGHVLNEARIDGRWQVLDANTNVLVDVAWQDAVGGDQRFAIHQFPHPGSMSGKLHRAIADDFQDYEVNMLLLGAADNAVIVPGRAPDASYASVVERLY